MHLIPDPCRFDGIRRDYVQQDIDRLSGSFRIRHTMAEMGATRLWQLLKIGIPFTHVTPRAGAGPLVAMICRYGAGPTATACWARRWNSSPRAFERRRLKRKVNSSR